MRRPATPLRHAATAAALVGALLAAPTLGATFPYEQGDVVQIRGVVTDAVGEPISGLRVVLEASKAGFAVWPPGRVNRDTVRGTTQTDAAGEFALDLRWRLGYNHFELLTGVPVAKAGEERLEVLATVDLTRRFQQGSPVTVTVRVEDTSFLDAMSSFLASLETADEKRVYQEQGKPDRVDRSELAGRTEASWWYFDRGKVYRFVDGGLRGVEDFDPIAPL